MKAFFTSLLVIFTFLTYGQYPLVSTGYNANAPLITLPNGDRVVPNSFIDAKGIISTANVDGSTGIYIRANNASNLPDVGLTIECGNTSSNSKFGIFGNGTYNTTSPIHGIELSYENTGTGQPLGSSMYMIGKNPWGFDAYSITNSSTGTAKGGDFYSVYGSPVTAGQATAKGLESYGEAGTAYGVHAIAVGSAANVGTSYGIYAKGSGALKNFAGYFEGNVTITGVFSIPSDIKLKKNIVGIENALSKIVKLTPANYEFKVDEYKEINLAKGSHYGFIAQEIEKIFPELVSESSLVVSRSEKQKKRGISSLQNASTNEDEKIETAAIKTINYIEMIPILTKAIQEQQKQIEELKAEIAKLKK